MTKSTAACIVVIAFMLAALVSGQTGGGIEFGRTAGGVGAKAEGTHFIGRADELKTAGRISTYRGNVRISLPAANVVIHADEASHDSAANELVFSGTVRLKLDSK